MPCVTLFPDVFALSNSTNGCIWSLMSLGYAILNEWWMLAFNLVRTELWPWMCLPNACCAPTTATSWNQACYFYADEVYRGESGCPYSDSRVWTTSYFFDSAAGARNLAHRAFDDVYNWDITQAYVLLVRNVLIPHQCCIHGFFVNACAQIGSSNCKVRYLARESELAVL